MGHYAALTWSAAKAQKHKNSSRRLESLWSTGPPFVEIEG